MIRNLLRYRKVYPQISQITQIRREFFDRINRISKILKYYPVLSSKSCLIFIKSVKICVICGLSLYALPVCGFSDTLPVVSGETTPVITDSEETMPIATQAVNSEETTPAVTQAKPPEKKKHLSFKGFIATPNLFRKDGQRGLGFDVVFGYYIGDIYYERKDDPNHFFEPIKYTLLCGDVKWALMKREKDWGLAVGGVGVIPFKGNSSSSTGGGGDVKDVNPFGYGYIATGREFKSGNFRAGLLYGQLEDYFNPLSNKVEIKADKGIFLGLERIFFDRRLGIEFLYPIAPKEAEDGTHLLINTFIERFIGFDLAFLIAPDNFSVMGYFNARLTLFPYKGDK
ncbi:hypothetical protein KKC52_05650 [bacterium]|nr:hypothetical protein [bacterium]